MSRLGGDLAQGLLEHLGRLTAGDQVPAVDHHRRHRVDAPLLPVALALPDLGCELVGIEHCTRPLDVEADLAGQAQQHFAGAGILGPAVVGGKQRMLQGPLPVRAFEAVAAVG